jgi:uridine kinase
MGKIIGIGGVSRAGKTSLALRISDWLVDKKVKILHQDDYVVPNDKMPLVKGQIDWEKPESLDFTTFHNEIIKAQEEYDYIIAEGLMVYWNPEVYQLFDKSIFIEISKETFLSRKTLDFRWENMPEWYIEHIWNNHFVYGRVSETMQGVLCMSGESQFVADIVRRYLED